ncbi:GNAT family N-acetyltransferase [Thermodesulfobacteriota bacterium]
MKNEIFISNQSQRFLGTINGSSIMGNRGRFGKYGEVKRSQRLRQSIRGDGKHAQPETPLRTFAPILHKPAHQAPPLKIRPAKKTDISFIGQLSSLVFSIYGPYEDYIPSWFALETTVTLLAVQGKKSAGFVMAGHLSAEQGPENLCELLAIAVEPLKQGLGIGHQLINAIENSLDGFAGKQIILHTALENHGAQKLFLKKGYQFLAIKNAFYACGQDAVLMVKEIGPNAHNRSC